MRSEYRDLVAYQRAVAVARDLHAAVGRWPSLDRWSSGVQLIRAADSIGANIAEAAGRWHRQDQRRFLLMARGSLYETEHWICCAEARGLLEAGSSEALTGIARALAGLINHWGST